MTRPTPQTEAGKQLLRSDFDTTGWGPRVVRDHVHRAVLAIEDEARTATAEAAALAAYDENAAALLDALPSFLDDVRAFMDSPEPKRSPGVMAERRRRLTVSLVWMGQRAAALAATGCLCGSGSGDSLLPRMDIVCPVHDRGGDE